MKNTSPLPLCLRDLSKTRSARDTGAVKQVTGETDETVEEVILYHALADCAFGATAEQYAVGDDDTNAAFAL